MRKETALVINALEKIANKVVREKAIKNTKELGSLNWHQAYYSHYEDENIADDEERAYAALENAFKWEHTPEGYEYWNTVHCNSLTIEPSFRVSKLSAIDVLKKVFTENLSDPLLANEIIMFTEELGKEADHKAFYTNYSCNVYSSKAELVSQALQHAFPWTINADRWSVLEKEISEGKHLSQQEPLVSVSEAAKIIESNEQSNRNYEDDLTVLIKQEVFGLDLPEDVLAKLWAVIDPNLKTSPEYYAEITENPANIIIQGFEWGNTDDGWGYWNDQYRAVGGTIN